MREWRNRQTRTFEGRVVHTVRVQVPFLAPTKKDIQWMSFFVVFYDSTGLERLVVNFAPG